MLSIIQNHQKKIILLFIICFLQSCNLYKIPSKKIDNQESQEKYFRDHQTNLYNKYIVIHYEDEVFTLSNFTRVENTFIGNKKEVSEVALEYYEKAKQVKNVKIGSKDKNYREQIHLYLNEYMIESKKDQIEFNTSNIKKIETLTYNNGFTLKVITVTVIATLTTLIMSIINILNYYL